MSMRGTKRASGVRGDPGEGTSKRRRTEPEDALWQLRPVSDLKMSSIYNRSASEAPAELFRKDLISAMKLPDSEPLTSSEYWVITDTWKQDWERGVQVPVNPDSLPAPKVKIIENPLPPDFQEFKLPKDKYIHLNRDGHYDSSLHQLSTTVARAEAACSYDLDATDTSWLKLLNAERARAGAAPVAEDQIERVIEELEVRCWDKIQAIMKSEEGLGIEYDENVICDVCRSPDSEDGNEMVFCDSCNICVHQACYGITVIPPGQWLCRPCGDGARPTCALCPNLGGAMKCTPSGNKWAHVSCVLWIPEVSIGCAEKMEPITKISGIPASRWSLVCVLCRERKGACIQCSVKTCKTAYHVTCAFKHGLEMRAIIEDENADDGVKLRSYCQKHSVNSKKDKCPGSGSEEEEVKRKRRKDMTSEEKSQARAARLQEIEREFDKHVSVKDISTHLLDVDQDAIYYIYNYWKLKRRAAHNRPLLPPKSDDSDLLSHRQEQADLDKMKMFVQLRQDLERVRNLCYMVSRREKLSRSFFRMREQTFHKQVSVLSADPPIAGQELSAIIEANHGPSIYDRLYSHPDAPDHKNDFDELLARIAGYKAESGDDKKVKDLNGLLKGKSSNPYKKMYVNGSSRRSGSICSGLSSEESAPETGRAGKNKSRAIGSSTDAESPKRKVASPKKKVSPKGKALVGRKTPRKGGRKRAPQSKALVETSSEDDSKAQMKKDRSRSKTLQQMEKEMTAGKGLPSGSDSEELVPIRSTRNNKFPIDIYSDSSENDGRVKADHSDMSPSATNDSQQQAPRTKAAKKEFVPTQPMQKVDKKEPQSPVKKRGRKSSTYKDVKKSHDSDDEEAKKENIKYSKTKDNPTDLIVPQRQAAKKASENMRSTTAAVKVDVSEKHGSGDEAKTKPKPKPKKDGKEIREPVKEKDAKVRKMSSDIDKETIAYVPQRQAAKKAAAHIKSGLGSKLPVEAVDEKKKEPEKTESTKPSPRKTEEKGTKSEQKSSSSSSSNSSSSSYTSSSSSEEEEKPEAKPMVKAREIKPAPPRQAPLFSPTGARPTVDLPFLDRVSRPLSSTSASSDSESSKASRCSGSNSPTPKRPRRRRKTKSVSTDASPRKAPDKKLKTSERRSELGVPSSSAEGEEQGGAARAATRSRTRSTTAGGNLPDKPNARQRKPSKDDAAAPAPGTNKASGKESGKPSQLPTPERKTDEAVNRKKHESPQEEIVRPIAKPKDPTPKRLSVEETIELHILKSPQNSAKNLASRRQSVKEPASASVKERRASRLDTQRSARNSASPTKKPAHTEVTNKLSPIKITDYSEPDKHWFPKVPSPTLRPPPVEKQSDNDKYINEDRSMDSDSIDKTSIKMIAKIQETLNENTMIKSPKTPMDARTNTLDLMDVEYHLGRNIRKRSILETDKKFITQDASHVQGVEISKSAKIPSTVTPYPNRSMFSPQSKENELFEFDILSVDDGFNHDEAMIKPFSAYPDSFLFKEDSKEQGVQETQNLVDRLRMQLSNKIGPSDAGPEDAVAGNEDKEPTDISDVTPLNIDSVVPSDKNEVIDLVDSSPKNHDYTTGPNHVPVTTPPVDLTPRDTSHSHNQKWAEVPLMRPDVVDRTSDGKYEQNLTFNEDLKEPTTVQSDIPSVSEIDRDTVSKQSDDSQSLSVVDHSVHSNDLESMTADNQNYDNNNSLIHSDCATISSPYVSQEKWRGESKITQRRSSASSTNSEASVCSQKTDMNIKSHVNSCDSHPSNVMPEMEPYENLPSYSASMPLSQYSGYPEASSYITSMPLFPGPGSALSPGPGLFAPALPFNPSPLIPPLPKPTFPTLCAAFTSSSQNIALTTAMIAPPTPKQVPSPSRDDIDVTGSTSDKSSSLHVVSSPSVDSFNDTPARDIPAKPLPKPASENSNETVTSIPPTDSKSPAKPPATKAASKGKSPGKSPGFSPKQSEGSKGPKRPNNRNNRGQRGRGRSKSRAGNHGFPLPVDYMGNSIQSKLAGTVYDFNEEIANDDVDLKSLRERRKSVDVYDRKSDTSLSPHIGSPVGKRAPLEVVAAAKEASSPAGERPAAVVQPVLPGPVDMRTYQALESAAPSPAPAAYHHSHLYAFASGTADQHLPDIDEEMEKQLHTALMASKELSANPAPDPPAPEPYVPQLPKVSLSDSRNQLKVKIKGPFLDANYSTSSVTPAAPAPPAPQHDIPSMASTSGSGNTNLRRMRKKELLRQYWTQDMNMDEPSAPPPAAPPPLARAVITIPKAVASMTSIPTREDYKGVSEIAIEKKKRKTTSGLSRELRHLEVSMKDDVEGSESAAPAAAPAAYKRRGRVSAKPGKAAPLAPKLKIKIGSGGAQPSVSSEDSSGFHFRPPKKRFQKPSIEDLRRESMKYRRKVMADFEEDEKVKKHKPNKSEKRKKKKDKKADKLQVVNSESDSATKLIIKIKRTKEEEAAAAAAPRASAVADPFEYDPSAPDPLAIDPPSYSEASSAMRKIRTAKLTPIRLKLARSAEGSGYVMKGQGEGAEPVPAQPLALSLNKHCEVR